MFQKAPALFNIQTRCYSGIHVHYEVNAAIKRFVESKVKDSWKLRKALMSEQVNSTLKWSVFPPCLCHFQTFGIWKSNHTKLLADTQSSQFSCFWTQLHTTENRANPFLLQLKSTKWLFDTTDIRADEMQKQSSELEGMSVFWFCHYSIRGMTVLRDGYALWDTLPSWLM